MHNNNPATLILCFVLITCTTPTAAKPQDIYPQQSPGWRLEIANDAFVNSDNQFSSSISLERHTAAFNHFDDTPGTMGMARYLASFLLPDNAPFYRESWALGQNLQPPENKKSREILLDDVPYVGMIAWENTYIAFDDRNFSGFQLLLGWVGEEALGKQTQTTPHKVIAVEIPKGWDHQLDREHILNLFYTRKHKLWRYDNFDGAISYDAAAGNFFTYG